MAERHRADEKPASDDSAKGRSSRSASPADGEPDEMGKAGENLVETNTRYVERLTAIQQEAIEKSGELLRQYSADLAKLQAEITESDPTAAFVSDVLRAYRSNDQRGMLEAYAALTNHVARLRAMSERRYRDIVKSSVSQSQKLTSDMRDKVMKLSRDYANQTMSAVKAINMNDLDMDHKLALAQALMISIAFARPQGQQ